ncbi:hypothetical protein TsFJ059_003207 [Trichoderma semiorbis]|uniref:Uncharacterized protein n=1 Tax=Trichoderma semiorbis TaxID=1491008 RepID=A0A9P8HG86_9HYPO|nr:hypothetical protein TsFJ059_003207 [Trichoderma semiorbis]
MADFHLTQTVADAFNALADEVQVLTDRKTILEHKLRFAHEQFQYLADKYAPATPEIAETLAKLQLPAHTSVDDTLPVPLPKQSSLQSQHQIALIIRDGRRAANKLVASLGEASKTTASSRDTLSQTSHVETSMSTALEQDFTVEGKKGNLQCPFAKDAAAGADQDREPETGPDLAPDHTEDPICVAMYEEETSQQGAVNGTQASKCPIRFLDKHSPEEIAHYVETHKHELPRSHEVCVRRYQRNEDQIRKLDAKYGNIVSMIEDLSHLHKPMLPDEEHARRPSDATRTSADRVESWAHAVSSSTDPEAPAEPPADIDEDRQSHFDRPLKEVRVGESPSRPWGISVPVYQQSGNGGGHPMSPPPAPVRMPSPVQSTQTPAKPAGKCPFGHGAKPPAFTGLNISTSPNPQTQNAPVPNTAQDPAPYTPTKAPHEHNPVQEYRTSIPQPTFINPDISKAPNAPQMVFTGPVFIGYPMEQAIQFMNQYQQR